MRRVAVVAAFVLAGAGASFAAPSIQDQEKANAEARMASLLHDPRSPVLGNPDGDVVIVEFFDYECPFTKAVEPRLQALLAKDKNVALVVKDFPILTRDSRTAAKAALAAVKQGKHDAFHRALLAHRGYLTDADIFTIAAGIGLDVVQLRRDMSELAISDHLVDDFDLARALRIFDTPSFVVNAQVVTQPSAKIDFAKIVAAARAANGEKR
jgi:protein-disulfide isomerase